IGYILGEIKLRRVYLDFTAPTSSQHHRFVATWSIKPSESNGSPQAGGIVAIAWSSGLLAQQYLQNPTAKIGQIVRLAARDKIPINDHRSIFPNRAGVDQIILDAGRTGHAHA